MAEHWAPVIYQELEMGIINKHGLNGRADFITKFDFDGDECGDNNWENAEILKDNLSAYVYYDVKETDTHWFIYYAVFHPRDWSDITLGPFLEHENDMEAMFIVIEKDGDFGKLIIIESMAHNIWLNYPIDSSIQVRAPVVSDILDGVSWQGTHPVAYIEAKGHGIYFDRYSCGIAGIDIKPWEFIEFWNPGVKYIYGGTAEEPILNDDGHDFHVLYDLKDIKELWKMGNHCAYTYVYDEAGLEAFHGTHPDDSSKDDNKVHPPWTIPDYIPIDQCPPIPKERYLLLFR